MSDADVEAWAGGRSTNSSNNTRTTGRPRRFRLLLGLYFIIPFWQFSAGEALHCFRAMASTTRSRIRAAAHRHPST